MFYHLQLLNLYNPILEEIDEVLFAMPFDVEVLLLVDLFAFNLLKASELFHFNLLNANDLEPLGVIFIILSAFNSNLHLTTYSMITIKNYFLFIIYYRIIIS